jgi:hypothetical protein
VRRHDPLEALVGKGKGKCVALHEARSRNLVPCDSEHRLALIESDDVSAQMTSEEACPTRYVKDTCGRERGENPGRLRQFPIEPRPFLLMESAAPEVPVVVLGRSPVVVLPHLSRSAYPSPPPFRERSGRL